MTILGVSIEMEKLNLGYFHKFLIFIGAPIKMTELAILSIFPNVK